MDVPHDDHHLGAPVRTLTAVPWQLLGGSLSQSMPTREANLLASASAHGASVADLLDAYATHASLTCRLRSAFHACMARAESANKRRRVGGGASSSSTSAPQPTTRAGDNAAWGAAIPLLAEALRTHGVYRGLLLDRIAKVLERAGTDAEELVRFSDVNASVAKDLAEEDGEDSKTAQRKKLIADVEAMVAERLAWLRGEVPEEGGGAGASSLLPASDKFCPPPLAHLVEKRLAGRGDKVDNACGGDVATAAGAAAAAGALVLAPPPLDPTPLEPTPSSSEKRRRSSESHERRPSSEDRNARRTTLPMGQGAPPAAVLSAPPRSPPSSLRRDGTSAPASAPTSGSKGTASALPPAPPNSSDVGNTMHTTNTSSGDVVVPSF